MIIYFVPGMFGSTVEYVLRNFTNEYEPQPAEIMYDGSMHSFPKELHPDSVTEFVSLYKNSHNKIIVTMIYPFEKSHLDEIIATVTANKRDSEVEILIYATDLRSAELNVLIQYHKLVRGFYNFGLSIMCGDNVNNIANWNTEYKTWEDMQVWELREWLSIFYPSWVREWIDSRDQVNDDFLKINFTDILHSPATTWRKIINHCGLTIRDDQELINFSKTWQEKQKYIVDNFDLIDLIVNATLGQQPLHWEPQQLNIISEAIIQQRLRVGGYEIKCFNLNEFPTTSDNLFKLLEPI